MSIISLQDKKEIIRFLRKNVYLHIYGIGDLDDFFWPYTTWYGLKSAGKLEAVALLYAGLELPVLLALSENAEPMLELVESIVPQLPATFYAHLSPGLETVFLDRFSLEPHGRHYKMALVDPGTVSTVDCAAAIRLGNHVSEEVRRFYDQSFPGHWFDTRMLNTGQYFGLREKGELVSVAGIHVYSPEYNAAALGNIATDPDHRGKGYGTLVTARVCRSLLQDVTHIGLNVNSDNAAALSCYNKLGFETVAEYGEFMMRKK
jgi:ribosomal protein S18 acetylase RimI-like enzyme